MLNRNLHRTEAIQICDLRFIKTANEVAEQFGVSSDCVNLIWSGDRWAELKHPNQKKLSKPRLTKEQTLDLRRLRGTVSPEEAATRYNLSVKRVLAIWREK